MDFSGWLLGILYFGTEQGVGRGVGGLLKKSPCMYQLMLFPCEQNLFNMCDVIRQIEITFAYCGIHNPQFGY